jgi:hypothetical protein
MAAEFNAVIREEATSDKPAIGQPLIPKGNNAASLTKRAVSADLCFS